MVSLEIILLILSLCGASGITYLICAYTKWYFFWIGLFLVPALYLVFYILTLIILIIWGSFLKIGNKKGIDKPHPFYASIIRNVSSTTIHLLNTRVKVNGLEKLPDNRKFILINNHISNFDQMALLDILPKKYRPIIFISKPQNMKLPIAGPFVERAGYIPINRENPKKGLEAINKAVDFINRYDVPIGISPEGTRNKTKEIMLPFHPGSFKIAYKANCPVVVCSIKNTNLVHKNTPFKHTTIYVNILDVIYPKQFENMNTIELSEICRNKIIEDLIRKEN
jgi:1-acyl-sn-glycerol-3-phosphate acyltransferase